MRRTRAGRLRVTEIDAEKDEPAVRSCGVEAVPTLIFFDSDQREIFRRRGCSSERRIREHLKKMGVDR